MFQDNIENFEFKTSKLLPQSHFMFDINSDRLFLK